MDYAVISAPAAPVRRKPDHRQEMINQLLFGEQVQVLKNKDDQWYKIRSLHDGYEGWVTGSLLTATNKKTAMQPLQFLTAGLLEPLRVGERVLKVPAGSSLTGWKDGKGMLGKETIHYSGEVIDSGKRLQDPVELSRLALPWLHAPYLWGGRTPLGVDCSGFTQVIFRQMGIALPRDAWQQAGEGKRVKKFSEAKAGDLLFFHRKKRVVHVGILLENSRMIHASGRVRIDQVDKKGVTDPQTGKRMFSLITIRRVWQAG